MVQVQPGSLASTLTHDVQVFMRFFVYADNLNLINKGMDNNKPTLDQAELSRLNQLIDDEPMMTEEDQAQIREVVSDINEKAFYGKLLKTKKVDKI